MLAGTEINAGSFEPYLECFFKKVWYIALTGVALWLGIVLRSERCLVQFLIRARA